MLLLEFPQLMICSMKHGLMSLLEVNCNVHPNSPSPVIAMVGHTSEVEIE